MTKQFTYGYIGIVIGIILLVTSSNNIFAQDQNNTTTTIAGQNQSKTYHYSYCRTESI